MYKSVQIFFFFALFTQICFAQWTQTSGPYGGRVLSIGEGVSDLFTGTDDGVFRSSDLGLTWTLGNNGLTCTYVWPIVVSGDVLFTGTIGCGIFRSTNAGANWIAVNTGVTENDIRSLAVDGANLFAGGTSGGIFVSTNSGSSWASINDGLPSTNILSLLSTGIYLFAGTNGPGIFRTTNMGTTWDTVNTGLTSTVVISFAIIGTNLFAGTWHSGVFVSTNYGTSWGETDTGVTRVHALVKSGSYLFAGGENGVFLSSDNGTNWINTGLVDVYVMSLGIAEGYLFAGTLEDGVWRRPLSEMVPVELNSFTATANGKEVTLYWSTATELNNQGFEVQRKFGDNNFVTIGYVKGNGTTTSPNNYTYVDKLNDAGKYFYRLKQIDFGGKYEYSQTMEINWSPFTTYKLEQNYPNPLNPTSTIGFGIPEKTNVRLSVLNIIGEEIKVLINEEKEAGYHSVDFNASDLPSGVYFYRIQSGNFIDTKKMLMLK